MKKYIAFMVVGLFLFSVAYAENDSSTTNQQDRVLKTLREQIQVQQEKSKEDLQKVREDFKQNMKDESKDIKELLQVKREATMASIKEKTDAFKAQMDASKEEAKTKIETQKAELKIKLEKIKNEAKKLTVEKIAEKLNEINTQSTEHFANVVNQMEEVLVRIESRTDKAALNNVDVTAVRTAITNAEASIASTRTAVATQAAKVYSSNITTESTLKEVMKNSRELLKADITTLKATVKTTREAVQKAATELAKIPKIDDLTVPVKVENTNDRNSN